MVILVITERLSGVSCENIIFSQNISDLEYGFESKPFIRTISSLGEGVSLCGTYFGYTQTPAYQLSVNSSFSVTVAYGCYYPLSD